jgi:SepF-like predicted cell division protein (DUF552 family)
MKKGYVLPLVFVLIIALVAIVGSITFITTSGLRNIGGKVDVQRAAYIAEAGLNKAIWYLSTPADEGGMGIAWRTEGVTEEFGGGSYTIKVADDPGGLKITAISTYKGYTRNMQMLAGEDFLDAYTSYALLSDKDVSLAEGTTVEGGMVAVTEGNEVTGAGAENAEQTTTTDKPQVETTYYDNQIAVAEAGGGSVVTGPKTYTNLNLSGATLYVNGDVTLSGDISGAADIVASGNITVAPNAIIRQSIKLIAKNDLFISTGAKLKKNVVLFAGENVEIGNYVINLDPTIIVTPKNLKVGSNSKLLGKLIGGNVNIGTSTIIQGNVIGGNYGAENVIQNSANIILQQYEQDVPPGFTKKITFKKWLKR